MRFQAMIFDLDGTLLNTLGDLAHAVNYALSKRGCPARSEDEVRAFVGNGVRLLCERALPAARRGETDACLADFRAYYGAHLMDRTIPYAGMPETAAALRAAGVRLAVVSNKYDPASKALVRRFYGETFSPVFGERDGVPKKPDPAAVLETLTLLGAEPAQTAYVGDSGVDMQTAKNAGLFAIGVSWGFRSRETLLEHGADTLVDRPETLISIAEGV